MAEPKKEPLALQRRPKFQYEGTGEDRRLFLLCSECEARIREIDMEDRINLRFGHYCKNCDPGIVLLNPGTAIH